MSSTGNLTSLFSGRPKLASQGTPSPEPIQLPGSEPTPPSPPHPDEGDGDGGEIPYEPEPEETPREAETKRAEQQAQPEETRHERGVRKALTKEREARQAAERKLIEYQTRLQIQEEQRQRANAASPEEEFDITDDDILDPRKLKEKVLMQAGKMQKATADMMFQKEVAMARHIYPDYEEVVGQWNDVARENPGIVAAVQQSLSPAFDAYRMVKKHLETKKMSSPEEIERMVKEKAQELVQQELAKHGIRQAASLPTTLSGARGSGGNKSKPVTPSAPASIRSLAYPIKGGTRR